MSTEPASQPISIYSDWKAELSNCISSIDELLNQLGLKAEDLNATEQAASQFPIKVPQPFVKLMEYGNPKDPLLKQVLPITSELQVNSNFSTDPVGESSFNPVPGIVHKYRNRVLMIISPNCAINCRYCFRRHFPYEDNRQSKQQWLKALDYLKTKPEINEVIYSGGDPLAANDNFLSWLTGEIESIKHIKRLRIHTRLPVVIPSRIDDPLLNWLSNTRLKTTVVLHINHANEIDIALSQGVDRLKQAGILVLNQSVLLKGVNDNSHQLTCLSEKLFDAGILPYYLHMLDPVQGASHFDVPEAQAVEIFNQIQSELPGFLVPKLVQERAGETSKSLIL
ncbi:EF-P beta-lysylation protein EpmB [Porticoccaceae bacterium]|jgi:L-lysine 2,3-aminomutase|nr:EF-P beta-lysylation protein EpmB [Porticoccaceae bacterium]MDA9014734.1 EF-P beta-lysylation protein EpmB [Porticoccaceae bacterium]